MWSTQQITEKMFRLRPPEFNDRSPSGAWQEKNRKEPVSIPLLSRRFQMRCFRSFIPLFFHRVRDLNASIPRHWPLAGFEESGTDLSYFVGVMIADVDGVPLPGVA